MEILAIIFVFLIIIIFISKLIPSRLPSEFEDLTKRVVRLEKQLRLMSAKTVVPPEPVLEKPAEQPISESTSSSIPPIKELMPQAASVEQTSVTNEPLFQSKPPTDAQKPILTDALERYVGQHLIGWAAVTLAIFAIGFFIKYAYENGWIIPEGRVAIGEIIGLGLIAAGWRQHRKGNALGSQMLLGCGIAACYLATYAAFGFYDLISQPTAGIFMSGVMLGAGCLAVATNAFSLGMLTVLGGLLTPLMLHTGQDQHTSLFTYLTLLVASIYLLYCWKAWRVLRSLVWAGAILHFVLWYVNYYSIDTRPSCFVFLGLIWLIPLVQLLTRSRRFPTLQEDWLLFVITPMIVFGLISQVLLPDHADMRGKIAIGLILLYGMISYGTWRWRPNDYHQFLLPLAVALIFLSVTIPLELAVGWIGIGWITQGMLLWGVGLWRNERLVRFFGIGTLLLGTIRIFTHDVYLHPPLSSIPFMNAQAIAGLWLSICWVVVSWFSFLFQCRLSEGKRIGVILGIVAFWLFWVVANIEIYPYFKSWQITSRWIAIAWMALALLFFWQGCRLIRIEWRLSAVLMVSLAVIRSLLTDLPLHRTSDFVPLFNQLSLPVLITAFMLLALRPILIHYEPEFQEDEKHLKPISGLTALAMIFLILSLDTYQFCVVNFPAQQLLPHAVLSVVWSLYGALLMFVGFWKHLSTLRWSAIGIFGITLGKVLMIDLGWLAGLYRILALLLIAIVLGGVTWVYQRRHT